MTDYGPHNAWIRDNVNEYIVSNDDMMKEMIKSGVGKDKIHSFGIPIENDFYDDKKNSIYMNDVNLNLTAKEYDLLLFLVKNKGKAFSRDQILDAVWGSEYFGSDRVVDDLMRRLRQKMPSLSVETIYGFGYRLL